MPDVCRDNLQPSTWITYINSDNEIYIEFSEEVTMSELFSVNETTVEVTVVVDSGEEVEFEWSIGKEYVHTKPLQSIRLDTYFYNTLVGDGSETIYITW
jgi:hypothetical protein